LQEVKNVQNYFLHSVG